MSTAKRRTIFDLILISLVVGVITVIAITTKSFWGDEVWSINAVSHDLTTTIKTVARDIHPPLYFLLLKAWSSIFGLSETSLRIFQGLQGILLLYGSLLLFRKMFPQYRYHPMWIAFVLSSELWLFLPMLRYYTFAAAIVLYSSFVYLRWLDTGKKTDQLLLSAFYVILLLTDYPSSIIILFHLIYSYAYYRRSFSSHVKSVLVVSLLFAPWVVIIARQISFLYHWKQYADFNNSYGAIIIKIVFALYAFVFGETTFPVNVVTISPLIFFLILAMKFPWRRAFAENNKMVVFTTGTILSGLIFTSLITTFIATHHSFIYTPSRTFLALPFVFLIFGIIFSYLDSKYLKYGSITLLLLVNVYGDYNWFRSRDFLNPVYAVPWKQILGDVEGRKGIILSDESICYDYYVSQHSNKVYPMAITADSLDGLLNRLERDYPNGPGNVFVLTEGHDSTNGEIPAEVLDYFKTHKRLVSAKKYVPLNKTYLYMKEEILKRQSYDAKVTLFQYEM